MARDEKEVVSLLRQAVADKVGQERMELWLRDGEALRVEEGVLVVSASDEFSLDRIRRSFREELAAAGQQVLGERSQVTFRVDNALKRGSRTAPRKRAATHTSPNQRVFDFNEEDDAPHVTHSHCAAQEPSPVMCAAEVSPAEPRTHGPRRFAKLESFVVSEGNRYAHAAALKVVRQPGQASPLYLHGPNGCGKTHLAEGVWCAMRRLPNSKQCLFLAAEQFTTMFLEGLHGQGLPSFRRKIREVDLLVIDDIQFLHGKRATLQELLNTVEHFARERKQLVLVADRPPGELPGLGPELVGRLSSGLVADLSALDESARRGVLEQQLAARGQRLPEDVLELLARELPGDGRRLQGALNRLEAMHEATGQAVTASFAREALKDLIRSSRKLIRLIDIDQAVCEVFGLPAKSLHTEAKARAITKPRMLAMWLARKYTRAGLSEISEHFGLRSHSTVISAQKKVTTWMQEQKPLSLGGDDCNVEEALRRVEASLKAM